MDTDMAKSLLEFQLRKDITSLYKSFLTILDDIRDQHFFMLEKLDKNIPPEYHNIVQAANYMDNNTHAFFRKKILDAGNHSIRQTIEQVDKFQVTF